MVARNNQPYGADPAGYRRRLLLSVKCWQAPCPGTVEAQEAHENAVAFLQHWLDTDEVGQVHPEGASRPSCGT